MSLEIVDNIHVLGLQNLVSCGRINPIEVTLDSNEIIERLSTCKKYKYRFLDVNLLFSSNLENDTDLICITSDGLSDVKGAVIIINSKIYKTLGVVYLPEIKNWNLIKGKSKRSQAVFVYSEYHAKSSHFAISFISKNVCDLFSLTIPLLNGRDNKITFISNETKVPAIGFQIQIVK